MHVISSSADPISCCMHSAKIVLLKPGNLLKQRCDWLTKPDGGPSSAEVGALVSAS